MTPLSRRPLKTRSKQWAVALAQWLIKKGVNPNHISLSGIVSAAGAVAFLMLGQESAWQRPYYFFFAAVCIQLRLLCNMLDGMVAIEGKRQSKLGDLYNEFPDRIEDIIILVGAGYCAGHLFYSPELGWAAALGAVLTAYIRSLGVTLGASAHFCGPMAKPHRMAVLTVGCLMEAIFYQGGAWITLALFIIFVGIVFTCVRRVLLITQELRK